MHLGGCGEPDGSGHRPPRAMQVGRGGLRVTGGIAGAGLPRADGGAAELLDALRGDPGVLTALGTETRGGLQ